MREIKGRKKTRKKNTAKRVQLVLTLLLLVMSCAGTLVQGGQKAVETKVYYESVQIKAGDTLWDLAQYYKLDGKSTERMVAEIMELNGMISANIRAGEQIIMPVEVAVS